MFTDEQIDDFFTLKRELPGVEFKGHGNLSDNPLFGRVVRAAMGMANRRNGGTLIIGVAEGAQGLCFDGLTDAELATWRYEDVADGFNAYAEPPISFEYQLCEWNGKHFLILHIHEFTNFPIICKKEYRDDSNASIPSKERKKVIQKGFIYARTTNKPETKEIVSVEGMRPVFEIAINKGIQRYVEQTQIADQSLLHRAQSQSEELFRKQCNWVDPMITKITSRGYWQIVIRPESFDLERIDFDQLFPLIQNNAVNLRGLSFPYVPGKLPPPGEDWVSSDYDEYWVIETWRFYQSGQFIYLGGILDDWRDQNHSAQEGWKPGATIHIEEVVYRCTEFFEFASRLALNDAYRLKSRMHIRICVTGLKERALSVDPYKRLPIFRDYVTSAEHINYKQEFTRDELVARPKKLALRSAMEIFKRFNWHPSEDYLQAIQSEIG